MTENLEPTALDLLKEARGALFIERNRIVTFGHPTKAADKALAKIDAFLAKTQDAGQ